MAFLRLIDVGWVKPASPESADKEAPLDTENVSTWHNLAKPTSGRMNEQIFPKVITSHFWEPQAVCAVQGEGPCRSQPFGNRCLET